MPMGVHTSPKLQVHVPPEVATRIAAAARARAMTISAFVRELLVDRFGAPSVAEQIVAGVRGGRVQRRAKSGARGQRARKARP